MAIILTMAAFVWNVQNEGTYRNGFNAFVVGLLWMKVVGFLKASDVYCKAEQYAYRVLRSHRAALFPAGSQQGHVSISRGRS